MYLEIHKNAPKVYKRKWRGAAGDVAATAALAKEEEEAEEERGSKMNFALFRIINLKLGQH